MNRDPESQYARYDSLIINQIDFLQHNVQHSLGYRIEHAAPVVAVAATTTTAAVIAAAAVAASAPAARVGPPALPPLPPPAQTLPQVPTKQLGCNLRTRPCEGVGRGAGQARPCCLGRGQAFQRDMVPRRRAVPGRGVLKAPVGGRHRHRCLSWARAAAKFR